MPATPPVYPPPGTLRARIVNRLVSVNTVAYRLSGGRVGGRMGRAPVLLLDHVGRMSGETRTSPLLYFEDGDDLIIVASRGGSDAMPAWWLNLKANPRTTVQIGKEKRAVTAREVTGDDKARLWARAVEMYPDYAVYQRRTKREIPVIALGS